MRAGAAIIDVTPPAGLMMSGFAARTQPAIGAHDGLSARALAIDDTAIVVADMIGLHEESCERIRARAPLDRDRIIVAATHTHGGPVVMRGRVGGPPDERCLKQLEDACVLALEKALAAQQPAQLLFGAGADPDVARNRRRADGPIDASLPVIRIRGDDGAWLAVVASHACHPVVLGADNRRWTADYPGFARRMLEAAHPGAIVLFLMGCCGDANTGHSAQASISLAAQPDRTFEAAQRIGERIAACALQAEASPMDDGVGAASAEALLDLQRRAKDAPEHLAACWRAELDDADPARRALLTAWIGWAETIARLPLEPWRARVTAFDWGGLCVLALPGEIFAATAHDIRARLRDPRALVLAFCNGVPGYIPPREEYAHGGYEIDDAHRYYGMPAPFAPGSAERLADAAIDCARRARDSRAPS